MAVIRSRGKVALGKFNVSKQLQTSNVARIALDHLGGLLASPIQVPCPIVNHGKVQAGVLVSRLGCHRFFEQAGSFLGIVRLDSQKIAHAL